MYRSQNESLGEPQPTFTDAAVAGLRTFVVDDEVAYIGGMNLRRVDWDTSDHEVFDARRMLFDVFAHSFFNPEEEMSAAELLMMFHFLVV